MRAPLTQVLLRLRPSSTSAHSPARRSSSAWTRETSVSQPSGMGLEGRRPIVTRSLRPGCSGTSCWPPAWSRRYTREGSPRRSARRRSRSRRAWRRASAGGNRSRCAERNPRGGHQRAGIASTSGVSRSPPCRMDARRARGDGHGMPETPSRRRELRPEIQGLRAVAVALVVVYHLWPHGARRLRRASTSSSSSRASSSPLPATRGERTGASRSARFWARRARRLLPASLHVLCCCARGHVASSPHLLAIPLRDPRQRAVRARTGTSPRRATTWPPGEPVAGAALLVAVGRGAVLPRLAVADPARRARWPAAATAPRSPWRSALHRPSLALDLQHGRRPTVGVLRHPDARLGVRRSAASSRCAGRSPPPRPRVLSWRGLAAIRPAALALHGRDAVPGVGRAAARRWGALAVIARARRAGALLGCARSQFLGDISYSVYLWHWPLLVLAPFSSPSTAPAPRPRSSRSRCAVG